MQQHTSEEIIGSNLARYRKSAGMTQSALAGEIGTSIAFVSRVEKGEKMMKVQTLCAAARALDVSLDALVSADGPAAARADTSIPILLCSPRFPGWTSRRSTAAKRGTARKRARQSARHFSESL